MDTLCEDICTFVTVLSSVLLTVGNVVNKSWRENQNTHFTFSKFSKNRILYELCEKIW